MTNLSPILAQVPSQKPTKLELLLDTLEATEELWRGLPSPYPLFLEEIRQFLSLAVEVGHA
jgi:hypothetical protein